MHTTNLLPRPMILEEFAQLVDRAFQADCSPGTAQLTLIDARPSRDMGGQTERPPFTLTFHSSPAILLVAGMYAMQCGSFGPELIHITPVVPLPGHPPGHHYQAVFN